MEPLVLVVDDDDDIRQSVADLVHRAGFGVQQARDGAEALALLRGGMRPRVILMDLCMPELDGWGVLAAMEADPKLAAIPVIIMSADAKVPKDRVVVRKPFESDELLQELRRLSAKCVAK